jgi:poly [ADP-ribose] polymerase 2/3/4
MNSIPRSERYLTMVTENNNNKFYHMVPNNNGTWTASWGRIGNTGGVGRSSSCTYQNHQWDAKYAEKIAKGYKDISDVYFQTDPEIKEEPKLEPEDNSVSAQLMRFLATMARNFARESYTIGVEHISPAMIEKGNSILQQMNTIAKEGDVPAFNKLLRELYCVVPRAMRDTRSCFPSCAGALLGVVNNEQQMLDSIASVASYAKKSSFSSTPSYENLVISRTTPEEDKKIKALMGNKAYHFTQAWKVSNVLTEKKFDTYKGSKETKLLWHGSRNENFLSILQTGLLLNPNAVLTGKMFGYGIYFAPSFQKSLGYTSLEGSYWARGKSDLGLIALFEVATGKPYDVYSHSGSLSSFREKDIKARHCDSLFAHKGSMLYNDEIVVYNESACTIRYLIEVE